MCCEPIITTYRTPEERAVLQDTVNRQRSQTLALMMAAGRVNNPDHADDFAPE